VGRFFSLWGSGDEGWIRMRRRAGVAVRFSRPIALATLAALGCGALGLASSAALAGHASPLQVTTGEPATTSTPTTTSTSTTPAPDRKLPPPPKPDPKPKPARAKQPPPPPAPQPPAPQPAAPRSPAPAAAVSPTPPPPPPAASVAVPRPKGAARQHSTPRVRPAQPSRPPAKAAPSAQAPDDLEARQSVSPSAAPTPAFSESDTPAQGGLFYFVMLFVVGALLLIGVSVVPPARVPWPVVAGPLYEHRSNLAAIGIGTMGIALICLSVF
jgi:hypothetical protein